MLGWNLYTKQLLNKRLEVCYNFDISFNEESWYSFIETIIRLFNSDHNSIQNHTYNILYLDFINTYRGYRHLKRLPVRGQRTWTNAWTSFRCNTLVSNWKVEAAKKYYGNYSNNILNMLFMSEYVNYLWRLQWKDEWMEARRKRIELLKKKKRIMFKIDIVSTSKGYLGIFQKNKVISKKKKSQIKKNSFTIGFSYNYTKLFLQYQQDASLNDKKRIKIVLEEEVSRVKNIKKKKKVEIKKKKEKKSLWD